MKISYFILLLLLILGLFLRTYRISDFLGFYYDQGRDGLVVWNLIHSHKLFLIGPTTGIEGIFLGPLYYYLITPFYALGGGDPVFPAIELALINVLAIALMYYLSSRFFHPAVGLLTVILSVFSAALITDQRWLSNPTPLPFFSIAALITLLKSIRDSPDWVILLGLLIGLSLQFEAASAIFFIPSSLIVLFLFRRQVHLKMKSAILAFFAFFATLLPQLIFDFRHDHIIYQAFRRFLLSEKSFQALPVNFISTRLDFYFQSFARIIFPDNVTAFTIFILCFVFCLKILPKLSRLPVITLSSWFLTPMLFLLFYHGNHGQVWAYYFTGAYPAFIILFSAICYYTFKYFPNTRIILLSFLLLFFLQNFSAIYNTWFQAVPPNISLSTSTQAVDWVYQNSTGQNFNLDVYVPPVISSAYDYLALWRGSVKYHRQPASARADLLYTIYEPNPGHPYFLSSWLDRQNSYGYVTDSTMFGLITVQRRIRR